MKLFFKNRQKLLNFAFLCLISYLGICLSIAIAYGQFPIHGALSFGADSDLYWDLSTSILHSRKFSLCHKVIDFCIDSPHIDRMPFYPVLLAVFRGLYDNYAVAYYINYVLYIISIVYFYKLIVLFCNPCLSSIALAFIFFSPITLKAVQSFGLDLLAMSLVIMYVFYFIKVDLTLFKRVVICSLIAVAGILTRQNLALFFFTSCFWCLFNFKKYKNIRIQNLLILIVCVTSILLWSFRNYTVSDRLIFTSFSGRGLYLEYVYYKVQEENRFNRAEEIKQQITKGSSYPVAEAKVDEAQFKKTLEYVATHPVQAAIDVVKGLYSLMARSYYSNEALLLGHYYGVSVVTQSENRYLSTTSFPMPKFEKLILDLIIFTMRLTSAFFLFIGYCVPIAFILLKPRDEKMALLKSIAGATFIFLIATGVAHGKEITDRGYLPVSFLPVLFLAILYQNTRFKVIKNN